MVEKSFLVQKLARIPLGMHSIIGYSVAGEETVVQVPGIRTSVLTWGARRILR